QMSGVTVAELEAFAAASKQTTPRESIWPTDERFWFSGTAGIKFTAAEDALVRQCWTRVLGALSANFVSLDHRRRRPNALLALLDRIVEPRKHIRSEGDSTAVLE